MMTAAVAGPRVIATKAVIRMSSMVLLLIDCISYYTYMKKSMV